MKFHDELSNSMDPLRRALCEEVSRFFSEQQRELLKITDAQHQHVLEKIAFSFDRFSEDQYCFGEDDLAQLSSSEPDVRKLAATLTAEATRELSAATDLDLVLTFCDGSAKDGCKDYSLGDCLSAQIGPADTSSVKGTGGPSSDLSSSRQGMDLVKPVADVDAVPIASDGFVEPPEEIRPVPYENRTTIAEPTRSRKTARLPTDDNFREKVHTRRTQLDRQKQTDKFRQTSTEMQEISHMYKQFKMVNTTDRETQKWQCRDSVVGHFGFEMITCAFILLSAILMGVDTATNDRSVDNLLIVCNVFFCIELLLRCNALRNEFLTHESRYWNMLDTFLVITSLVDMALETYAAETVNDNGAGPLLSTVRMLKIVRLLRIFRILRFWRGLWDFVLMIVLSLKSLMLALVLLSMMLYVFALSLTINVQGWLQLQEGDGLEASHNEEDVHKHFGDIGRCVYTLIQVILGGVSWGEVTDVMLHVGAFNTIILFIFIIFTMLAVLNIITGVFVDGAMKTQDAQKDYLIEQELKARLVYYEQLLDLFESLDADHSGIITLPEIVAVLDDKELRAHLSVVGLDVHDANRLFHLLDKDGSGSIAIEEFVGGVVRLRGNAQSIDLFDVAQDVKKIRRALSQMCPTLRSSVMSSCQSLQTTR